jgi:AcrR family transcriptional regulator
MPETSLPPGNSHRDVRERSALALRDNALSAAARLLVAEGPAALTVRRIARELDCSTKVLYTLFQGKHGIGSALYQQGCDELRASIATLSTRQAPADYFRALAQTYWSFAMSHRGYYQVMFGSAIPNFVPKPEDREATSRALAAVIGQVENYVRLDLLPVSNPALLVQVLWSALHGVVSLYLLEHFGSTEAAEEVYQETTHALLFGLIPDVSWQ